MLEAIILYINNRISGLDTFARLFSLCELIKDADESVFPAEYCSKDEYKNVTDFDFFKGVAYHRLRGEVTRSEIEGANSGCDLQITQTYPMRTVALVGKDILNTDNNFIDLKIAENIINILTIKNNNILAKELKADVVTIKINSYTIDKEVILSNEFQNIKPKVDFNNVMVSIDYDVIVEGSHKCFEFWGCNDEKRDIDFCPAYLLSEAQLFHAKTGLSNSQLQIILAHMGCAFILANGTQELLDCLGDALCPVITEIDDVEPYAVINGVLDDCI